MQFVESESEISATIADTSILTDTCAAWSTYSATEVWAQDDSGI